VVDCVEDVWEGCRMLVCVVGIWVGGWTHGTIA